MVIDDFGFVVCLTVGCGVGDDVGEGDDEEVGEGTGVGLEFCSLFGWGYACHATTVAAAIIIITTIIPINYCSSDFIRYYHFIISELAAPTTQINISIKYQTKNDTIKPFTIGIKK